MFWDTVKGWVDRDREKFVYKRIDPKNVDQQFDQTPLEAGRHYIRLRLAEMFLTKEVVAAKAWIPAVNSLIRLDFAKKQVEVPNIADLEHMGLKQTNSGDFIIKNFMLTPAMPFSGGTVSVSASLMAFETKNYLNSFIGVLGSFAGLLAVPQLSTVLNIAQPLANGIQELFGAGNGHLHLGLYEAFSAGEIKNGYIAAIRATEKQVDPSSLEIVQGELREPDGGNPGTMKPFTRFDYMLFRVEIFEERDDWAMLSYLDEPFQQAIDAVQEGDETKADLLIKTAVRQALRAPDLTEADRARVVAKLKEKYRQAKDSLKISGLVESKNEYTLAAAMKKPMPVKLALDQGVPTLEEAIADL